MRRLVCGANSCVKLLLHTEMTSAHRHTKSYPEIMRERTAVGFCNRNLCMLHTREITVFGTCQELCNGGITCIRGSCCNTAIKCFMNGHWPGHPCRLIMSGDVIILHPICYHAALGYGDKLQNKTIICCNITRFPHFTVGMGGRKRLFEFVKNINNKLSSSNYTR
jgi:hypothetical protein